MSSNRLNIELNVKVLLILVTSWTSNISTFSRDFINTKVESLHAMTNTVRCKLFPWNEIYIVFLLIDCRYVTVILSSRFALFVYLLNIYVRNPFNQTQSSVYLKFARLFKYVMSSIIKTLLHFIDIIFLKGRFEYTNVLS